MNSTHKPFKTGDNIHIEDFTEQVLAYIHVIYLNTDKKGTHALKTCCIKEKQNIQNNTFTCKLKPDVHQHSDNRSRCTSTLRLTRTYLQNNHLLTLVHHYGSLNCVAVYTLIVLLWCLSPWIRVAAEKTNDHTVSVTTTLGETPPSQVNGQVYHWHVSIKKTGPFEHM